MLSGKYKEIVESFYIEPKNEVIVSSFIEENDYDKDENSIGLPMKRRKIDIKVQRKMSEPFLQLQKNKEMAKMSKFKRTHQLISPR